MPVGVIVNTSSVFLGGLIGALFGGIVPPRIRGSLSTMFGVCSIAMGIFSIVQVQALPAVILSVILGLIIGELIYLERGIERAIGKIRTPLSRTFKTPAGIEDDEFMEQFVSIMVLFCASGTGIFGSMVSGMTGDHTILIAKSILDFFTALTFAISLGPLVSLVAIPQAVIMLTLFFCSGLIYPMTTELMRSDFIACGGVLMLATGFRISGIKNFPIANLIPSMALVMPISSLWTSIILPLLS